MSKSLLGFLLLVGAAFAASDVCGVTAVDYRDPSDGYEWGRALGDTLTWRWAAGAASATLAVSNVVSGATSVIPVTRNADETEGSSAIPGVATGETLVDVTLRQDAGEPVTVRLKFGSPEAVYAAKTEKGFKRLDGERVFSWSDRWADAAAETASLTTTAGGTPRVCALPATGGFATLDAERDFGGATGAVSAALAFDGAVAWTADLYVPGGLLLLFR